MKKILDTDAVSLLQSLVRIPSFSSQEKDKADFLENYCQTVFGKAQIKRDLNSLIITIGSNSAQHRLLVCSHIDTVAPSTKWTKDPFCGELTDNKIFGLGANDAHASCVAMLAAISRVQDSLNDNVAFILALVAEEEIGDQGFKRIEPLIDYTCGIFGEPTEMRPATEMRGYMRLKLIGNGKACHASRPWEGENAIINLMKQILKIDSFNLRDSSSWGQATIQPTLLNGGSSHNQIPDYADAILDVRTTKYINNSMILDMLDEADMHYEKIHTHRNPMQCDDTSEVMRAVLEANPKIQKIAFGGTCDMAFATKPSIVMGPGKSIRSHSADEYIECDELTHAITEYTSILNSYNLLFK